MLESLRVWLACQLSTALKRGHGEFFYFSWPLEAGPICVLVSTQPTDEACRTCRPPRPIALRQHGAGSVLKHIPPSLGISGREPVRPCERRAFGQEGCQTPGDSSGKRTGSDMGRRLGWSEIWAESRFGAVGRPD